MMRMTGYRALAIGIFWAPNLAGAQRASPDDSARIIRQSRLQHPRLIESSGLAPSRRPGVYWTLNDSGNPPELFAIDTMGHDLGVFRVSGVENVDWEALAGGPCGEVSCLYIADVGDNRERRPTVTVYRLREPELGGADRPDEVAADASLAISYADGPHDVEAIFVTPAGDLFLISKGRSGSAGLYRVPGTAWRGGPGTARAVFVQELPIPVVEGLRYQVTDAALARDGPRVAVRTYRYIYFFTLQGGRLLPENGRPRCDATGVDALGEALAWLGDERMVTTSEQVMMRGGTVTVIECRR